MSRHGHVLHRNKDNELVCPESGLRYEEQQDCLRCIDLDENNILEDQSATNLKPYRFYKNKNYTS